MTTPFCLRHYRAHALDRKSTLYTPRFKGSIPKALKAIPTQLSNSSTTDGGEAVTTRRCVRRVPRCRRAGPLPLRLLLILPSLVHVRPWSSQWELYIVLTRRRAWRRREQPSPASRIQQFRTLRLSQKGCTDTSDSPVGAPRYGPELLSEPRRA